MLQVLAHFPASIQLEILGKVREQRVYENRATFASAAHNPQDFSQTQMSSYLKSCAFKRKVGNVIVRGSCLPPSLRTPLTSPEMDATALRGTAWRRRSL